MTQYFEDFAVGQKFGSGRSRVEAAEIKDFAARFDPQPFHLDEAADGAYDPIASCRHSAQARSTAPSFVTMASRPSSRSR
jgi:acyl dehydratase